MVADGMGGAVAGELASEMAADLIYRHLATEWATDPDSSAERFAFRMREAVELANARIYSYAREHPEVRGMGTTVTAAGVYGDDLYLTQIGDSRAYLVRNRAAIQLTKDQSLMQRLVDAGELTEEEAEQSERRNIILQALGPDPQVKVDLTHQTLRRGDTLIICSDGLSGLVRRDEFAGQVAAHADLPSTLCGALIDLANERGGPDNITVVAARFDGDGLPEPTDDRRRGLLGCIDLPEIEHEPTDEIPTPEAPAPAPTPPAESAFFGSRLRRCPRHRGRALPARRGYSRSGSDAPRPGSSRRLSWVGALSFASGLPYFFFTETVPVWLAAAGDESGRHRTRHRARRCPWVLKFLWAPLVDRLGSRRPGSGSASSCWPWPPAVLAGADPARHARSGSRALLLFYVTLSATQDIAIDAYTIETTHGRELGVANSVRIGAYRARASSASALLVWVAARQRVAGGVPRRGGLARRAGRWLRSCCPRPRRVAAHAATLGEPIRALLRRPGIWAVLLFALLFKLDISAMDPMTKPFWVAEGFSLDQIAALTTGRLLATLAGAALGRHHGDAGGNLPGAVVAGAGAAPVEPGLCGGRRGRRRQGADHGGGAVRELRRGTRHGGVPRLPHVGVRAPVRGDPVRPAERDLRAQPLGGRAGVRRAGGAAGIRRTTSF